MRGKSLRLLLLLVTLLLALGLAGCGGDDDDEGATGDTSGATDTGGGEAGGDLVFGTAADPVVLDGALVSDGESLRAIDQIFETLVALKPGTTELEPGLAESWEARTDGLTCTFTLRDGVKFHDGEPFNAEAVCANFDRWYNFKRLAPEPERVLLLADRLRWLRRRSTRRAVHRRTASTRAARPRTRARR